MCGVASQGKPGFLDQGGWFVKTYTLAYSKNGENWANYKEFGIAKVKSLSCLCFGGISNLLRNLQKTYDFLALRTLYLLLNVKGSSLPPPLNDS